MMPYRVIALPKGSTSPVKDWIIDETQASIRKTDWEELCLDQIGRARAGDSTTTTLFLCLLGDQLIYRRDSHQLNAYLESARNHSWGSKVYLVISDRIRVARELIEVRDAISEWLAVAAEGRVIDLIQAPYDPFDNYTLNVAHLRDAAGRVEARQRTLRALRSYHKEWRCLLPPERQETARFLGPRVDHAKSRSDGSHRVIVIYDPDPKEQSKTMIRGLRNFHGGHYLVVTLDTNATSDLWGSCQQHGLEPLELRGEFELWYLLERLNRLDDRTHAQSPEFGSSRAWGEAGIALFTSSFEPSDRINCLAASEDVGRLLKGTPLELRYRVEPAITHQRLLDTARNMQDLRVWVHMGHGHGAHGLYEMGEAHPRPPEQWVSCFRSRASSVGQFPLELAVFLTCNSAEIANSFFKAGAGAAIGFEGLIETNWSRELAIEIFRTMFREGFTTGAIRRGFDAARASLEALGASARPVYYPVAP